MPKRGTDGRHGVQIPSARAVIAAFRICNAVKLLLFTVLYCRRFLHHGIASAEAVNVCRHLPSGFSGIGRTEPPPAGFPRAQPVYHRAAAFRFGFCIKKQPDGVFRCLICTPNTGHPVLGVQLYEIQLRVQADVRCVIPTREMAGNAGGHTRKELSRNNSQVGSNGEVVWAGSAAAQESE